MRWSGTEADPPGQTQEPSHTRAPDESTLRPGLDRPARCAADFGAARHAVGLRAAGVGRRYRRPPVVSAGPGGVFCPAERLHRAARRPADRPSSRTTITIPPPRSGDEREDVQGGVGAPWRVGPGSALLPSAGRSAGGGPRTARPRPRRPSRSSLRGHCHAFRAVLEITATVALVQRTRGRGGLPRREPGGRDLPPRGRVPRTPLLPRPVHLPRPARRRGRSPEKTSPSFDSGQTSTEWSQVTLAPLSGAGVSLEL